MYIFTRFDLQEVTIKKFFGRYSIFKTRLCFTPVNPPALPPSPSHPTPPALQGWYGIENQSVSCLGEEKHRKRFENRWTFTKPFFKFSFHVRKSLGVFLTRSRVSPSKRKNQNYFGSRNSPSPLLDPRLVTSLGQIWSRNPSGVRCGRKTTTKLLRQSAKLQQTLF